MPKPLCRCGKPATHIVRATNNNVCLLHKPDGFICDRIRSPSKERHEHCPECHIQVPVPEVLVRNNNLLRCQNGHLFTYHRKNS